MQDYLKKKMKKKYKHFDFKGKTDEEIYAEIKVA